MSGGMYAWTAVMQNTLTTLNLSDRQIGLISFASGLGANIASPVSGFFVDTLFRRRLKCVSLGCMAIAAALLALFALGVPLAEGDAPALAESYPLLVALAVGVGLAQGGFAPLTYELGAELLYPVPEGTSAGLLVLGINASCLALILVQDALRQYINYVVAATWVLCTALVAAGVRERYRRADAESAVGVAP